MISTNVMISVNYIL